MNKKLLKNGLFLLLGVAVLFVFIDFTKDLSNEKKARQNASQDKTEQVDTKPSDNKKDFDTSDDSEFEDANEKSSTEDDDEVIFGAYPDETAYDFEVEVIGTGERVSLSDFRGQKVFLNFWASWCPPCRIEAPELQKFSENQDDVVVLGVNVTSSESKSENIQAFLDEFGMTFMNVYGTDEMFDLFYVESLPTSLFIDSEGVIKERVTGPVTEDALNAHFSMFD